jgi:hypothetical protein
MVHQSYRLPCGCVVERGTETIVEQCACCAAEWNERHARAAFEHRGYEKPAHWFEANRDGFNDGTRP